MAARKMATVMTRNGWVTALLTIVSTAGPIVIKLLKEHPEIADFLKKQVNRLLRNNKSTPKAMLATLAVLREQVEMLTESADSDQEAAQAAVWSAKLDAATNAAHLLSAPGSTSQQRKILKKQIDSLREVIFAAYVSELDEDYSAAKK